jgi:hypothetical protein
MKEFTQSQRAKTQLICANFATLAEWFISSTCGACIPVCFPVLESYLIQNIGIGPLAELFVNVAGNFSKVFAVSTSMILKLLYSQTHAYWPIVVLRRLLIKNPDLVCFAEASDVLFSLLSIGATALNVAELVSVEAFRLLGMIVELSDRPDKVQETLLTAQQTIDIVGSRSLAVPAILDLFPAKVGDVIDQFFEQECSTAFNQAVWTALTELDNAQLRDLTMQHQIMEKLVSGYDGYLQKKTNGHFLAIAQLLMARKICCAPQIRKEWLKLSLVALKSRTTLSRSGPIIGEKFIREAPRSAPRPVVMRVSI